MASFAIWLYIAVSSTQNRQPASIHLFQRRHGLRRRYHEQLPSRQWPGDQFPPAKAGYGQYLCVSLGSRHAPGLSKLAQIQGETSRSSRSDRVFWFVHLESVHEIRCWRTASSNIPQVTWGIDGPSCQCQPGQIWTRRPTNRLGAARSH